MPGAPGAVPDPFAGSPRVGPCPVFPADNVWNRDVSNDPVDAHSNEYLAHMNADTIRVHPDFGSNPIYGMPFILVPGDQPRQPMQFRYAGESDPGPYPYPPDIPIQHGQDSTGDRHAVALDRDRCLEYDSYYLFWRGDHFEADSGAVFDLRSNALRPDRWTSATAAGLPIIPGLIRYDEAVVKGEIRHALAFTAGTTAPFFVHPATHQVGTSNDPYAPPMGLRVRLRGDYDISRFHGGALVVLRALRKYGMFLTDHGTDWSIGGEHDLRWNDQDFDQLKTVPGSAFEVLELPPLRH